MDLSSDRADSISANATMSALDLVRRRLTDVTNQRPVSFFGSGLTLDEPYKLPSMPELGDRVSEGLWALQKANKVEATVVQHFDNARVERGYEQAVRDVPGLAHHHEQIIDAVQTAIQQRDLRAYEMLVRDRPKTGLRRWLRLLCQSDGAPAVVITTNYDRVIEYECGLECLRCYTGFLGGYIGDFASNGEGYRPMKGSKRGINLYKVHGSLGWFLDTEGHAWRLPLQTTPPNGMKPLMVVPGDAKYEETHYGVYRMAIHEVDRLIGQAQSLFVVGYGFNDPHIHDAIYTVVDRERTPVPVVILTRTPTNALRRFLKRCRRWMLLSMDGTGTRVESDESDPETIPHSEYWRLHGFMTLIPE
jgi:hypothetical protein